MHKIIFKILCYSLATAAFADVTITSPIHMKERGANFLGMQRKEPSFENLLGSDKTTTFKCIGETGYYFLTPCSFNALTFSKQADGESLMKIQKGSNIMKVLGITFSKRSLGDNLALQNHLKGHNYTWRDLNDLLNYRELDLDYINEIENLGLSDCTSFDDKILVCKTVGRLGINKFRKRAQQFSSLEDVYVKKVIPEMIQNDRYAVFVKEGAKIPQFEITSYNKAEAAGIEN